MVQIDIEKCQITRYPAKVLAKPSKAIEQIDENITKLVDKMADIMVKYKGIGLAGPQAGLPLRIFIVALSGKKEDVRAYINPIVTASGETEYNEEGCLSVPGIFTKIKRYKHCTVTATNLDGSEFTEEAEGLYARCLQHEYDHIQGVTIVNRMGTTAKIVHRKQLKKLIEKMEKIEGQ